VRIHPSSLNSSVAVPKKTAPTQSSCAVAIFDEKTRQEATLYVMQTTLVEPHVLLLVANRLQMQDDSDSVVDVYPPPPPAPSPICAQSFVFQSCDLLSLLVAKNVADAGRGRLRG